MKKVIKLTESEIKRLVNECIHNVLSEEQADGLDYIPYEDIPIDDLDDGTQVLNGKETEYGDEIGDYLTRNPFNGTFDNVYPNTLEEKIRRSVRCVLKEQYDYDYDYDYTPLNPYVPEFIEDCDKFYPWDEEDDIIPGRKEDQIKSSWDLLDDKNKHDLDYSYIGIDRDEDNNSNPDTFGYYPALDAQDPSNLKYMMAAQNHRGNSNAETAAEKSNWPAMGHNVEDDSDGCRIIDNMGSDIVRSPFDGKMDYQLEESIRRVVKREIKGWF